MAAEMMAAEMMAAEMMETADRCRQLLPVCSCHCDFAGGVRCGVGAMNAGL